MSGLLIDNISMRFDLPNGGSVQALKNVTLDIKSGELLSVLGPSGCGKTTLLNIVAGFLAPTEGQVVVNDHAVEGPGPERGMVFQQGALFEWMTVRENVSFGPDMKKDAAQQDSVKDRRSFVGSCGACRILKTRRFMSSQAACSNAWLWPVALANEPDVILMDEPLGALDALTREKMQSLVLGSVERDRQDHYLDHPLRGRSAALGRAPYWLWRRVRDVSTKNIACPLRKWVLARIYARLRNIPITPKPVRRFWR